jgi:HAD superfamily hydrolase (TIGR01509 family)
MPFTRPVAGVVFDMDGLLLDTERIYFDALFGAARSVGRLMTEDFARSMIGVPGKECHAMITAHYGAGFSLAAFNDAFGVIVAAALERDIPLRPGARELVTYLAEQGIPRAIATSSRRLSAERYMRRAGLIDLFAAIVTREDVENAKPAPDPFLAAAARLRLAPADCLALEDSHHGVAAAHAAGMMTIMVPDLLTPTDVHRSKCIAVVDDLHAVGALLRAAR